MPLQPLQKKAAVVASQTGSPSNYALLKPIAARKTTPSSIGLLKPIELRKPIDQQAPSASAVNEEIVVTPHSFKRGVFDEHEFKVHNASDRRLREAKIVFTAPIGSVVQQVSPKPDSVDGLSIILTVDNLAPGDDQIVEVSINYPRNEFAKFDSMVIAEKWGIASGLNSAIVAQVDSPSPNSPSPTAESKEPQGMLQPRSSDTGPKVPAMTVSTTTSRVVQDSVDNSNATGIELEFEAAPSHVPVPVVEVKTQANSVKSYLHGPRNVAAGAEVDFSIDVQNLSSNVAENIVVQLSVPQNMKVTILDREAWYDGETRKISWQLPKLAGQAVETIRYKAKVKTAGTVEQSVVTGMSDTVQSTNTLKTSAK